MRRTTWIKTLVAALALGATSSAQAGLLISEIYFNSPGSPDTRLEYIELCGLPNVALDDHYLIFLENENDEFNSLNPGQIENIFDLSGMTLGSNGYMVLGQKDTFYPAISGAFDVLVPANPAAPTIAESLKTLPNGAHAYVNRDTGSGFGNGATSSIQHVGQNNELEGSGFTAMLIRVDTGLGGVAPVFEDDLDLDNNGLDVSTGQVGWSILDSIGVFGEPDETAHGRLYAAVNFGPGAISNLGPGGLEPGATYIDTSPAVNELEYISRVGVGTNETNWMVANLTNDPASGYTNAQRNYAISGNHANLSNPEVYVGNVLGPSPFAYGTDITVTFGADNVGFDGTHVPEPSSLILALFGASASAVAVIRRRRVR
jgi:hypothetical protein